LPFEGDEAVRAGLATLTGVRALRLTICPFREIRLRGS